MEWAADGRFEDRGTIVAVNRRLSVPSFRVTRDGGWTVISTSDLTLRYREGSGRFTAENLEVRVTNGGVDTTWRPGMPATGNLGATIRSYEVALSGPPRLEPEADLARARIACREVPPGFDGLPWQRIEDPAWRALSPEVAAQRIAAALQARCSYDLDLPKSPSDPLSTFLFAEDAKDRRGICEHFAGAAALLLRRAGHPARVVAGFASTEWDGSGVLFRRLHAHAWVEVLTEDGRWKRADPTPGVAHSLLANLPHDEAAPLPDAAQAVPLAPPDRLIPAWGYAAGILGCLILILAVAARRRRIGSTPVARRAARTRRRGEELVRLATELGCRVGPGDTAADICRRLSARTGIDLAPELAAYQAARFGDGPEAPPWPVQALRAAHAGRTARP